MWVPRRLATDQIVSPGAASTCLPSSSNTMPWLLFFNSIFISPPSKLFRRHWFRGRKQFREVSYHARERIRGGLAEAANRCISHALRQLIEQCGVPYLGFHQLARL